MKLAQLLTDDSIVIPLEVKDLQEALELLPSRALRGNAKGEAGSLSLPGISPPGARAN